MVFALAVVLVFTILVIQFRAWLPAMLILLAAPLSLGGALLLLWLTGTDLNISSAMGLILLVGLVVKNGIMLLDFSEKLHAEGEPFEARHRARRPHPAQADSDDDLLHAVRPAAAGARLGAGAELQKPLALAVIGGLALSTPVTLLPFRASMRQSKFGSEIRWPARTVRRRRHSLRPLSPARSKTLAPSAPFRPRCIGFRTAPARGACRGPGS